MTLKTTLKFIRTLQFLHQHLYRIVAGNPASAMVSNHRTSIRPLSDVSIVTDPILQFRSYFPLTLYSKIMTGILNCFY